MPSSRHGTLFMSSRMPAPPLLAISTEDEVRPGSAHVLDGDDGVGGHQLEAGLDQQLLGEGVADLHGRALLVAILVEVGAGHGRAVDSVAAGLRADIDDRIADAGRGRVEDLVGLRDADGHRVDEDVAVVSGVEIDLAADRGDADAIAVAADAVDHARDQVAHLRDGPGRPKRSALRLAIGRAPMVKTSRRIPPTPVAAPW